MSELDDLSGYDDWELEILVQSYQDQIADLEEEIEGKQDAKVMDRVRREAITDLQDGRERKQGWLAAIEAEQKRRAAVL
jgi:hypothetical protein